MTIKEIVDYIINTYPNSSLAWRKNNEPYSRVEYTPEVCIDFFYHERLCWCGCGYPQLAQRCIRDYLDILDGDMSDEHVYDKRRVIMKSRFGVDDVMDNELLLCLAYALDAAGFTEHGGNIGGAWLTEEGKMFLYALKQDEHLDEQEE